jgi:arabinose-5-phosphate isomerase
MTYNQRFMQSPVPMSTPPATDAQLLTFARKALEIEAQAVAALAPRLDARFAAACRICLACEGRVVVTGMGKSGHIARKIAATFASTGTPAFFLHPAEAGHGDLGMITRSDVVVATSNSGETPELVLLLPHLKRLAVPMIVLAGKLDSTLGRASTVGLDVSVPEEACPLNLAPTASTTATLAMGDALAVSVLEARGFTKQDFAMSHPGGTLGRQLLLHVEDVMRTGEALPRISPNQPLGAGLVEMSKKGLGMTVVVDPDDRILGVFTDGDLRRALDKQIDVHSTPMHAVMTPNCKTIGPRALAAEAVHIMEVHRITALPVANSERRLLGALNVHDLFRAGVV